MGYSSGEAVVGGGERGRGSECGCVRNDKIEKSEGEMVWTGARGSSCQHVEQPVQEACLPAAAVILLAA